VKTHSNRTGDFLYPSVLGALQPQGKPYRSRNGSKQQRCAAPRTLRLTVTVYGCVHSGRHILRKGPRAEACEFVVFNGKADLDGFAAYLAVFNVRLAADGQVQHHRNLFSTIWTGEFVFHRRSKILQQIEVNNRSGTRLKPD
jgi:hypothetical protein